MPAGFAVALLEKLVRTRIGEVPRRQQAAAITIPRDVRVEEIRPDDLPGWDGPASATARTFGNDWYDAARSAVLIVPSLPAMGLERNLLINQRHAGFGRIGHDPPRSVAWDQRLFERS